ncbi:hypothetical protein ABZV60_12955 [Streptomyces sp. NPDC004787]|uniref:hypothetical protein n=1 Tax=Streptomyces sp. NPDC004787 TaxID=3154291 RepID=UPI0033B20C69
MDDLSFRLGNTALGNDEGARPGMHPPGSLPAVHPPTTVCVTGAPARVTIDGTAVPRHRRGPAPVSRTDGDGAMREFGRERPEVGVSPRSSRRRAAGTRR